MGTTTKNYIAKEDLKLYDSVNSTFTRKTSSGGTGTYDVIDWVGIDVFHQYGTSRNKAAIDAAVVAVGSTNDVRFFLSPGTWSIDADLTIASNVQLDIPPGAVLSVASGQTLTINGKINAGLYKIFAGDGSVLTGDGYGDGVYPQWWLSAAGDGSTDCASAIQSAINSAAGSAAGHYKSVYFVPGIYTIESTITLKTAPLIGKGGMLNTGVQIKWNGTSGVTAFDKDSSSHEGNNSFVLIENIEFVAGSAKPDYWLDFTPRVASVDVFHRLKELQFNGCTKSAIRLERWLNVHWEHLRFDDFGEYCVDIVTAATPALAMGTFSLDGFTADAITQGALGFFHVDTTLQQISNMGTFEVSNGRIEINTDLQATNPGIFVHTMADSGINARPISFKLRNVVFQDVSTCTVYVLYRDTADTNGGEAITLENFRHDGCDGLIGGTAGSSFNNMTLPASVGYLSLNIASTAPKNILDSTLFAPYATSDAIQLQNKDDTEARFLIDSNAYMEFGPGDGATDVALRRNATPGSGIYGFRNYIVANAQGINTLNKTTELTAMSGATVTWTDAIPAGSIVLGVTARVTTLITGATTFDVGEGDGGDADLFIDGMAVALDTTGELSDSNAAFTSPKTYQAETDILVTGQGGSFTAGALRLTLHYIQLQVPTS